MLNDQQELAAREQNHRDITAGLIAQGYQPFTVTVPIAQSLKALFIPATIICLLCLALYLPVHGLHRADWSLAAALLLLAAIIASIFVHELLHGLTWSIFCKGGWREIRFGIMREQWLPYCHCCQALPGAAYLAGALMPFLLLGLGLFIWAMLSGNQPLMWLSLFNIHSAGGDLLVAWLLRRYRRQLILDHPSECGFVAFELSE